MNNEHLYYATILDYYLDFYEGPYDLATPLNPRTQDRTPQRTFDLRVYFVVFRHPAIHKNNVRTTYMWLLGLQRNKLVLNNI